MVATAWHYREPMLIAQIYNVLYWFWIATEVGLQLFTRTRRRGAVKDRGSLLLLLPVIFLSISAAFWYGDTHPHNLPLTAEVRHGLGLALMIVGLAVRWAAVLSLGRAFSTNVAIHHRHALRTSGLYRWVRHPSYLGMLLIFGSIGVWKANWLSLAIVLVFPTAALLYRIHVEERALLEAFGEDYRQYRENTHALVPGVY